jgi:hypothetical protein
MFHDGFEQEKRIGSGWLMDKWLMSLIQSKRFMLTVASGMVAVFGPYLVGLDQELALAIVTQIVAWIVSDSIRPTDNVFTSRRFWAVVAGGIVTVAAHWGIHVDPEVITAIVMAVSSWIIGDGIRATLKGAEKDLQRMQFRDGRKP